MKKGKVKFFNESKGFGFITPDDNTKDVFVHHSGCAGAYVPQDGDEVSFDVKEGKRGPQAQNVKRA